MSHTSDPRVPDQEFAIPTSDDPVEVASTMERAFIDLLKDWQKSSDLDLVLHQVRNTLSHSRARVGGVAVAIRDVIQPADAAPSPLRSELDKFLKARVATLELPGLSSHAASELIHMMLVVNEVSSAGRLIDSLRLGAKQIALPVDPRDTAEMVSATELGRKLGNISDEAVRNRERAGELFSLLPFGRKRGREYPVFLTWPGLLGEPVKAILSVLRQAGNAGAYGFFTSPNDLLLDLTPIEVLLGKLTDERTLDPDAKAFLRQDHPTRLQAVLSAAEAHVAQLSA